MRLSTFSALRRDPEQFGLAFFFEGACDQEGSIRPCHFMEKKPWNTEKEFLNNGSLDHSSLQKATSVDLCIKTHWLIHKNVDGKKCLSAEL